MSGYILMVDDDRDMGELLETDLQLRGRPQPEGSE